MCKTGEEKDREAYEELMQKLRVARGKSFTIDEIAEVLFRVSCRVLDCNDITRGQLAILFRNLAAEIEEPGSG